MLIPPSRRLASLLAAFVVGAVVLSAGAAVADAQDRQWVASGAVLVVPRANVTEQALAGYYETLSRGLIPATYAEILDSSSFRAALPETDRARTRYLGAEVVPDTAVIALEARAPNRQDAEELAGDLVDAAVDRVGRLGEPYEVVEISSGSATAERRGVDPISVRMATSVAAVLLGVAALLTIARWPTLARPRRRSTDLVEDDDAAAGGAEPAPPRIEPRLAGSEPKPEFGEPDES